MPRITSFSLDAFVQEQIAAGTYNSASEVVRAALRHMADEARKEARVLAMLDEAAATKSVSVARRPAHSRAQGRSCEPKAWSHAAAAA
jgi:putative addiction module CopG family antidote